MNIIYALFIIIPCGMVIFHFLTKKYINPFKLIFVFGKKGSGKSTFLARRAIEYMRAGFIVYSNIDIPGTIPFDVENFGLIEFPWRSVVIVDEVGMIWDNRNFKNFKTHQRDYFKLQRHYGNILILASQTFDVDKKIRDLADEMWLIEKKFRVFSYGKRILRRTVLIEAQGDSSSRIDENLEFDSLLLFAFGSRTLTFIPKWAKFFDSFDAPSLPPAPYMPYPLNDAALQSKEYKDIISRSCPRKKRRKSKLRVVVPYRLMMAYRTARFYVSQWLKERRARKF